MLQYNQMNEETDLQAELESLPKGTIVRRTIRGTDRFYHQWRENGVTKSRYLSPGEIMPLRAQLERRKHLLSILPKQLPGSVPFSGSVPNADSRSTDSNAQTLFIKSVRSSGALPSDFRCDVLTGRFLSEYAASVGHDRKRDCYFTLFNITRHQTGSVPILFLVGPRGTGKTTLLRQFIHELPVTIRAKAAYIRLTGTETPADVTADLALLRNLGFRFVLIDEAHHLSGLAGTGLTMILAGESVPTPLEGLVSAVDISFIPFREFAHLTDETQVAALVERGGTLGTDPAPLGTDPDRGTGKSFRTDRFVLDVLALAAIRAKEEAKYDGEAFLGTDLHKLRNRFAEVSGLSGEEDESSREEMLDIPTGRRFARAKERIEGLLTDPILDRLGAAERKIVRDLLMDELRFRLLEDVIWNELRHSRVQGSVHVHRVPFAPGAYGFVIADEEELTCEVLSFTTDTDRNPNHLRYLDDPARLDVLEHRYGMITNREILYNGRDARLTSGVSYRNLAKYLTRLG